MNPAAAGDATTHPLTGFFLVCTGLQLPQIAELQLKQQTHVHITDHSYACAGAEG